MIFKCLN